MRRFELNTTYRSLLSVEHLIPPLSISSVKQSGRTVGVALCVLGLLCHGKDLKFTGRLLSILGVSMGVVAYLSCLEQEQPPKKYPLPNRHRSLSSPALLMASDSYGTFQWKDEGKQPSSGPLYLPPVPQEKSALAPTVDHMDLENKVALDLKAVPIIPSTQFNWWGLSTVGNWFPVHDNSAPQSRPCIHDCRFYPTWLGEDTYRLPLRPGEGLFGAGVHQIHLQIGVLKEVLTDQQFGFPGMGFIYIDELERIEEAQRRIQERPNEGGDVLLVEATDLWPLVERNYLEEAVFASLLIAGGVLAEPLSGSILERWLERISTRLEGSLLFTGLDDEMRKRYTSAMQSLQDQFVLGSSREGILQYRKRTALSEESL